MSGPAALMAGKRGVVLGVANDHSIAWGIAKALAAQGAGLALTYQGEAFERRVRPLAEALGVPLVLPCDVAEDTEIDTLFEAIRREWGTIDFVVHSLAYSRKEELNGRYSDTSRANFARTMDISCYSFTAVAQRAAALMPGGGSLLTLTYSGAERVMPYYNVMGVAKAALEASVRYLAVDLGPQGVRVNALSAGPMRTLAGSAIGGARQTFRWTERHSPLRRNVTLDELGGAALYLLSDMSHAVTGEVHHVDSGYNIVSVPGLPEENSPDDGD
jgi:enoyl-[acyl-carrier protein] reductase I